MTLLFTLHIQLEAELVHFLRPLNLIETVNAESKQAL